MPVDTFQREIDYLRISVTDHCNLRCVYCMPLRGLQFAPRENVLSATEIETVVIAAAAVGFRKVRLTGGEPTLRSDIVDIVRRIARVDGICEVAMTTNGILLPPMMNDLIDAGLSRINLHIDTLDADHIKRVMRFATIEDVWAGIEAVIRSGLKPLKINSVVVHDYNDQDVVGLAELTLEHDWHIRFIELMPLGSDECSHVALGRFVPSNQTRRRIEQALGPLTPVDGGHRADESRNHRLPDAPGVVGFISPVSEPYCGTCNRMRLTADGKLHLCLLHDEEIDLRGALRNGATRRNIQETLLQAVHQKPTGHRLDEGVHTERRGMFQIGG